MSNGPASDNQFGFKDEDGKCQACPQGQTCDAKTIKMCDEGFQQSQDLEKLVPFVYQLVLVLFIVFLLSAHFLFIS